MGAGTTIKSSSPKHRKVKAPGSPTSSQENALGKTVRLLYTFIRMGFVGVIGVLLCGFLINKALLSYEARVYKPLGNIIEFDGNYWEVWCVGPKESDHVVVIEQAAGATLLHTYDLMKELALHTRTCSYNRAGRMFTPPLRKLNGTALIQSLHSVLAHSGEKGPFVLVGHQFGSLLVVAYTLKHIAEVEGLVLLDPVVPSMYDSKVANITSDVGVYLNVLEVLSLSGLMRLITKFKPEFTGYDNIPEEYLHLLHYHFNQPTGARSMIEESETLSSELAAIIKNQTTDTQQGLTHFPPVQLILPEFSTWKTHQETEHLLRHISNQTIIKTFNDVSGTFPYTRPKETEALITEFLKKLN